MLLTRSRLCPRPKPGSSLHLHVLSTPPAFVLSQDQTLREELHKERLAPLEGSPVHMRRAGRLTGLLLSTAGTTSHRLPGWVSDAIDSLNRRRGLAVVGFTKPGHNPMARRPPNVHAVEFSKTAAPCWRGFLRSFALPGALAPSGQQSLAHLSLEVIPPAGGALPRCRGAAM